MNFPGSVDTGISRVLLELGWAVLFAQQVEQTDALARLLGEAQYQRLLDLYDRESSPADTGLPQVHP